MIRSILEPMRRGDRGKKLALILACWTAAGVFFGSRFYLTELQRGNHVDPLRVLVTWLICFYSWAALTPAILYLLRRFPLVRGKWQRSLLIHVPASVLLSIASSSATDVLCRLIPYTITRSPYTWDFLTLLHTEIFIYWTVVMVYYLCNYYLRQQQRELQTAQLRLKAAELESSLKQAQLDALKMQLHPHFLFNTLNTISALMVEDTQAANRVLVQLSELLRAALKNDCHEVKLREELEFLRSYLEIEQTRYQNRLKVRIEADPATLDAKVPHLILQPLVENAIKHGIAPYDRPGVIEVSARRVNGTVELMVRDNGPGRPAGRNAELNGIGLANTRARLEKLYGTDFRFSLENAEAGGLVVNLAIPHRTDSAPVVDAIK